MKKISISMLLCIVALPVSILNAGDSLSISDVWVLEAPPGMKVMAAYMTIKNKSENTHDITRVSSPQFERIEMHRTIIENEQARMEKQDILTVKAGDIAKFVPGGNHLMLFNPKLKLKSGDEIDLNLTLNNRNTHTVKAQVRKHSEMHRMEQRQ